jgi:uncharacterized protein YlxW (UPF0749 family)
MSRKTQKTPPTEILANIALNLSLLVEGLQEHLADLENRVESLEKKSRALRNRAPLREMDSRLRDAEIRMYRIERVQRGYPQPPPSGTAADK